MKNMRRILNDDELKLDEKNNDYVRSEQIKTAFNNICIFFVYFFPIIIVIWLGIMVYHYIKTNDYVILQT